MSGKDLMIYILENNLVDKSIYDEFGIPVWLMTVAEAAEKRVQEKASAPSFDYCGYLCC